MRYHRLSVALIKKGLDSLRANGIVETVRKTADSFGINSKIDYNQWLKTPLYTEEQLETQRHFTFDVPIKFSVIVPLYNTPETFLHEMIQSVIAQTYQDWELCMADGSDDGHVYVGQICSDYVRKDQRIRYLKLNENLGISGNSNACIDMAQGDYISLLDHDDVLHPAALYCTAKIICEKDAEFIYSDEAIFEEGSLSNLVVLHFKPDYAPDNLRANNYICHFTSFKRSLLTVAGTFRNGFEGAQDFDLFLRLTHVASHIVHIPKVLYYWRSHSLSAAESEQNKSYAEESGKKAVLSSIEANGLSGTVTSTRDKHTHYRVSYQLSEPLPLVSIVIPNYNHIKDLKKCISSIKKKTTYANYEIIIAENNSQDSAIFEYYKELEAAEDNVSVVRWNGKGFNWSAINNWAVRENAKGEYLLFLNNDTEVISPGWMEEMMMFAQRKDVGIVGAMLYYPNDTIQHAGVIIGLGGTAGYAFKGFHRSNHGYMGRLCYAQNLSAVTGACMMVRRRLFDEMDGFDEKLAVGWNDIDFCLRMREKGYLIIWTPFAELYHYEGGSRDLFDASSKESIRANMEEKIFLERWSEIIAAGDPYYNPNLTLRRSDFSLRKKYE